MPVNEERGASTNILHFLSRRNDIIFPLNLNHFFVRSFVFVLYGSCAVLRGLLGVLQVMEWSECVCARF